MWRLEAEVRNLLFHLIHEAASLNQARAFRQLSLASHVVLEMPLFQLRESGITGGSPCQPGFCLSYGDLNSGPRACAANILNNEPALQPWLM